MSTCLPLVCHLLDFEYEYAHNSQRTVDSHGGAVWNISVSHQGNMLAAACDDGAIRVFNLYGGFGNMPTIELAHVFPKKLGTKVFFDTL